MARKKKNRKIKKVQTTSNNKSWLNRVITNPVVIIIFLLQLLRIQLILFHQLIHYYQNIRIFGYGLVVQHNFQESGLIVVKVISILSLG